MKPIFLSPRVRISVLTCLLCGLLACGKPTEQSVQIAPLQEAVRSTMQMATQLRQDKADFGIRVWGIKLMDEVSVADDHYQIGKYSCAEDAKSLHAFVPQFHYLNCGKNLNIAAMEEGSKIYVTQYSITSGRPIYLKDDLEASTFMNYVPITPLENCGFEESPDQPFTKGLQELREQQCLDSYQKDGFELAVPITTILFAREFPQDNYRFESSRIFQGKKAVYFFTVTLNLQGVPELRDAYLNFANVHYGRDVAITAPICNVVY